MADKLLQLMPVGNSEAIRDLPEKQQPEISELYLEFWELWTGVVHPLLIGGIGPLAVAFGFTSIARSFPACTIEVAIVVGCLSYLLFTTIAFLISRQHLKEAHERFCALLEGSPDRAFALKTLHELDPLRTLVLHLFRF